MFVEIDWFELLAVGASIGLTLIVCPVCGPYLTHGSHGVVMHS